MQGEVQTGGGSTRTWHSPQFEDASGRDAYWGPNRRVRERQTVEGSLRLQPWGCPTEAPQLAAV